MNPDAFSLTNWIKQQAAETGFTGCGINIAGHLEDPDRIFRQWLAENHHAEMSYLEKNIEKRMNPALLHEGAKTVISLIYPYYSAKEQHPDSGYKIARFAQGADYHIILKEKLQELIKKIMVKTGEFSFRVFTDSAPVAEKSWAALSGLGWIGKNSLLITKKHGSFVFICEIICNLDLQTEDTEIGNFCGNCTKCIDACPTQAIYEAGKIDAKKCIAYHTIEYKDEIPESIRPFLPRNIYGCDICQDFCPYNPKLSEPHNNWFEPSEKLLNMTRSEWDNLSTEEFKVMFRNSGISRLTYTGLMNKIRSVLK